jgi:hypothetical protein
VGLGFQERQQLGLVAAKRLGKIGRAMSAGDNGQPVASRF